MAHPYLPGSNQKQESISQILVSTILSTLFPPLGMSSLGPILQLTPIHSDSVQVLYLLDTISGTTTQLHPLLKSTGILILHNHFCIYYAFLCLYIVTCCLMLIRLHLLQWFFLSPTILSKVSLHRIQIFVEYLVFTVIRIIDKEKFKFLGDRLKHHF